MLPDQLVFQFSNYQEFLLILQQDLSTIMIDVSFYYYHEVLLNDYTSYCFYQHLRTQYQILKIGLLYFQVSLKCVYRIIDLLLHLKYTVQFFEQQDHHVLEVFIVYYSHHQNYYENRNFSSQYQLCQQFYLFRHYSNLFYLHL